MSARAPTHELDRREFNPLEIGRLTWIGLTIAVIGWALLLGEATGVDVLSTKRPVSAAFHADLADIAKCLVGSGFGLAIVGALQTGFGALNRFFEAVLMRSAHRAPPVDRASPAMEREAGPGVGKRPYRLLADGSVEVDTILGTRRFSTMDEAREFI